uniref:Hypothetical secreted protein n=1 Tax=Simulium nigrimanum TaxID=683695 RepID=D1FPX0_SIMNI
MKSFGLPTATFLLSLLIADGEPVINSVTEMVKNILRNHCKMTSATVATDNGKKVSFSLTTIKTTFLDAFKNAIDLSPFQVPRKFAENLANKELMTK